MDAPILYIQWQSFLLSFVAIAIGLSSVSVHRRGTGRKGPNNSRDAPATHTSDPKLSLSSF